MLRHRAEVQGARHLNPRGLIRRHPGGDDDRDQARGRGGCNLPGCDFEAVYADENVERRDRLAHGRHEQSGQREGRRDAERHPRQAEEQRLTEEEQADFAARGAHGPQDADLTPPPDDGGGDRVVNEEHAHQQRDEAQRRQVELEAREHLADLLAAPRRRCDRHIARHQRAQALGHGFRVCVLLHHDLHGIESSGLAEEFLRPAYVHRGGPHVRGGVGVVRLKDESCPQGLGPPGRRDAQFRVAPETELRREVLRQRDRVPFAQPRFDIHGGAVRPDHAEGLEGRIGERVDAEQADVFTRVVGQGEQALDDRRGRGHTRHRGQRGQEGVGKRPANLEVRLAREQFHPGAERAVRALVRDHDREEHAHAESDAEDVEEGQQAVARRVPDDLAGQEPRPVAGHAACRPGRTAASCRARCRARTSRSEASFAPSFARIR